MQKWAESGPGVYVCIVAQVLMLLTSNWGLMRNIVKGSWRWEVVRSILHERITAKTNFFAILWFRICISWKHKNDILVFIKLNILGGMDMDIFWNIHFYPKDWVHQ